MLRNRFGSQIQRERFHTERKVRHRKPGEDLQSLHQDVQHLMQLAYPSEMHNVVDIVARNSFLKRQFMINYAY